MDQPTYTGTTQRLPDDIFTNNYFKITPIAEWSLESFLVSTNMEQDVFLSSLKTLSKIKRLPQDIQSFAHMLDRHYTGDCSQKNISIAKNRMRIAKNRVLMSTKEHLVVQDQLDTLLNNELVNILRRFWACYCVR